MAVNSVRVGEGDLSAVAYLGERFEVYLESPWGEVLAYVPPEARPQAGESVPFRVAWATAYPA
jgi:iron(III) transport system ATP-binding protein